MTAESAALIGHTGFVGGNLVRQRDFSDCFNSSNIEQIAGRSFDLVVCAGVPAEKWKANAAPERDHENITRLINALGRCDVTRLVLISTVDVFARPIEVDESSPVTIEGQQPYGRNRRLLEEFVASRFDATVVRLPGLYGPGLKKNAIFDLLHNNAVEKIDSRGVFQFYDIGRLWRDLEIALANNLELLHLATAPVSIADVARSALGINFVNELASASGPARYDIRTRHAELFGGESGAPYIETRDEELAGIAAWVASARSRASQAAQA